MAIEARVAQILTSTTVALNVGSWQGVSVGDSATISDRVEVSDPITFESLGEVDVEKVAAKVVSVKERVCVVKVTSTYTRNGNKYLKTLTDDEDLADFKTVFVSPGDFVEVVAATDVWGTVSF